MEGDSNKDVAAEAEPALPMLTKEEYIALAVQNKK
jgi:hypothetical protein